MCTSARMAIRPAPRPHDRVQSTPSPDDASGGPTHRPSRPSRRAHPSSHLPRRNFPSTRSVPLASSTATRPHACHGSLRSHTRIRSVWRILKNQHAHHIDSLPSRPHRPAIVPALRLSPKGVSHVNTPHKRLDGEHRPCVDRARDSSGTTRLSCLVAFVAAAPVQSTTACYRRRRCERSRSSISPLRFQSRSTLPDAETLQMGNNIIQWPISR